ncbi:MAG: MarR family winged helix-turn-helix transcriptional regulator [Nocardioidaceae bacterium]
MTQPIVEHPALEQLSAELVIYAGRLVRAVTRYTNQELPAATLRLLSQIDELGPSTIGHLAEADRCRQPTMSNAVHNLVEKGWARKQPNPDDARSSLVDLTPAGRTVLAEARRRNAGAVVERLARIPDHDVDDLARAVALLKGLLDPTPASEEGSK